MIRREKGKCEVPSCKRTQVSKGLKSGQQYFTQFCRKHKAKDLKNEKTI